MAYMSSHIWMFSIWSTVWNGWLAGGFSPRRSESDPKTVSVGFVAYKKRVGTGFSKRISLLPVSIIPPKQHKHLHVNTTFIRSTNGRSLGTFKQRNALPDIEEHWKEKFHRSYAGCILLISVGPICVWKFLFVLFKRTIQQITYDAQCKVCTAII